MLKRVLLIDNDPVQDYFNTLIEEVETSKDSQFKVDCKHFNPVDRKFEDDDREIDHELARKNLIEEYLNQKIDVIGCDFNLHETNKTLTFEIIKTIREYNSTCQLFIYSGAMNQELLKMFGEAGKNPAEKLLQIALGSNILEFVNTRSTLPEKIFSLLMNPSIALMVENFLELNGQLTIKRSFEKLKDKQLFEIAVEIRKNTPDGITYLKEIIEHGFSHLVDLNGYE
jgi:hypothetical protein